MNEEIEIGDERHPFRFMVKFVIFVGLLYVAGRFLSQKKNEYRDLTESQARSMFVEKAGPKIGDDTAEEIADQVIPKLKEKGLIKPDPAEEAADKVEDLADETADKVSEAVDTVVKD